MKFLVRWAFRFLLLSIVLIVAILLLKDLLLKSWLETRIRSESGMDVRIGKFECGLLSPTLNIEDFRLYNPAEFGGSPLIDMPELHLEFDTKALLRKRLHFKLARISVSEINIVEGKNGQTNLVLDVDVVAPAASGASNPEPVLGYQFQGFEVLNLTLGKVKYTSMRQPGRTAEVQIGMKNEIITQIRSVSDLRNLLLTALFRHGVTINTEPGGSSTKKRR